MPDENIAVQSNQAGFPPNPAIEHLQPLIGDWRIGSEGADPEDMVGQVSFEWLEDGAFLIQRWQTPDPFPSGVAVTGCDDSTGCCRMQYFDSRGVARIYEMSLSGGVWKQWRDAPGFSQRFTGTFSDDGDTIHATWELSTDGSTWEKDFDLVYRRISQVGT
ncbi:hypothetical protein BH23CHL2_BH23CHL2_31000 [soil metagenome]